MLECIARSSRRMTVVDLQVAAMGQGFSKKKDFKTAVKNLVDSGLLMYTSHFGCTFLELSCLTPFQVSERIMIKAPNVSIALEPEQIDRQAAQSSADSPTELVGPCNR